ncbi:MAG: DMT family transporter [Pseudomonadota bacterium]
MEGIVFIAVIAAALLHATWNAFLKGGSDKTLGMGAIVVGHIPAALLALLFVPAPAAESFPYLVTGILLHFGYQLFLLKSYQIGDLTLVYPIARGSAPLIVALVSLGLLGVELSGLELLAILIIGTGITSLSLVRHGDGMQNGKAALVALATGTFIAAYSLVDGLGARLAGTSLGFYSWLAIGNALLMIVYLAVRSPRTLYAIPREGLPMLILGSNTAFAAYALVTWAFTQAPIASVTALRETSIVFALLIGVFVLKERFSLLKVVATMTTLLGAILLRVSG